MIEWLQQWGPWAVLLSLLLSILISIVGVIPSVILSAANVAVFGLYPGFLISLAGEIIGAAVTYWMYQKGFHLVTRNKTPEWKWKNRVRDLNKKKQFSFVLIARITPLVPSAIVTFVSITSSIPFFIYFSASIIGKIPSIAMETIISHDLFYWKDNKLRLLTSVLLLIVILALLRKPKIQRE